MNRYELTFLRKLSFSLFALVLTVFAVQINFAQRVSADTNPVYRFILGGTAGSVVAGASSRLVRSDAAVTANLHTSGLQPGNAYTFWWVIYNNPEFCAVSPCSFADFGNPLVNSSAKNAAGHIVGNSGRTAFAAHLRVGDTTGRELLFGPGLLDSLGAEIHLIVRNHGRAIPSQMPAQISTYFGGCEPIERCSDDQIAIYQP